MSKLYYSKGEKLVCKICFRACELSEGATGFCGINQNRMGKLYSLVYDKPAAVHIDPIEKKPLYHFYPGSQTLSIGTEGCNFRCPFCQNSSLSFAKPAQHRSYYTAEMIIEEANDSQIPILAFTYNEPSVSWLWYRDVAHNAKKAGLKTVMVTNGAMSSEVAEEMCHTIDAVNVDLKCGSHSCYKKTLHGSREQVLSNLELFHSHNMWIELTTLLVPKISDSIEDLNRSAGDILAILGKKTPWHLSAYAPSYKYDEKRTSPELLLNRADFLIEKGFTYIYTGNIMVSNKTYCPSCETELIERNGYRCTSYCYKGACPNCGYELDGRF